MEIKLSTFLYPKSMVSLCSVGVFLYPKSMVSLCSVGVFLYPTSMVFTLLCGGCMRIGIRTLLKTSPRLRARIQPVVAQNMLVLPGSRIT